MINDGWQYPTQKTNDWATQNPLIKGGWTQVLSIDKHFLIDYWHPLWYSCLSRGRGKKDRIMTMRKGTYPCSLWQLSCLVWFYGAERHFQQYFSYIVAVSFIGGGNWSTQRKPPTCRKSLTNFITKCCIEYTSPERDSNSQR